MVAEEEGAEGKRGNYERTKIFFLFFIIDF